MKVITLSANTSWYLFNFRASTIRRLQQHGYRVVCLTPDDDYRPRLVGQLNCEWLPLVMNNSGSNPFQDAGLVLQFFRYYRKLKPVAALHFTIKNNVYGTWAARSLRVPAINNVSGLGTAFIRRGAVSAIVRLLYRTSQPFADCVFCQNDEDLKLLTDTRLVPSQRLKLLPGSGVDLERFNPSLREVHEGPYRFIYAGRMLEDKGVRELISAVRAINANGIQCVLLLCGFADAGNVSAITHRQLSAWGEEPGIEWLGPTDAMEYRYASADCVVLPSYREGMPRSLLEAGAMGLPVVTTDVAGCRNVIEDGFNGVLCEARSSASLQQAMQKMLDLSPQERHTMGMNGREHVSRKFSEQLVVEATIEAVALATNSMRKQ